MMGEPMSPTRLTAYAEALEKHPLEAIVIGLDIAADECRWFPKPVDIRDFGVQSSRWRRQQERSWDERQERQQKALGPPLSPEQMQANIDKLKAVVKGLAAKRRMR
jgi:hypothetical protein